MPGKHEGFKYRENPMSDLYAGFRDDLKTALLSGDETKKETLRMIIAACKKVEADTGKTLDDEEVINVLLRERKTRQESIEQFRLGGREDLVQKEAAQLAVVEAYLPVQFGNEEIDAKIGEVIAALQATTIRDMGKVMAKLNQELRGKADMKTVSDRVREKLGA
jgi:uncharacterized protein